MRSWHRTCWCCDW